MAVKYGFYNAVEHDRVYNADDFGEMFDGLITDGIYATIGKAMAVVAGSGMSVIVRSGRAWFNQTWTNNTVDLPLQLDASDLLLPRIDAVVLEVDKRVSYRRNSIKIIKGAPAVTPVKPTLSDGKSTGSLYQYPLAYIKVPQNSTFVSASNIENCIGNVTPFVTGILKSVSIEELWDQWKAQFNEWFLSVRSVLDGDVALNLQSNIDKCVKLADKAKDSDLTSTNETKWMTPAATAKMVKNEMSGAFGDVITSSKPLLESDGYYRLLQYPAYNYNSIPNSIIGNTALRNRIGFRYGPIGVNPSLTCDYISADHTFLLEDSIKNYGSISGISVNDSQPNSYINYNIYFNNVDYDIHGYCRAGVVTSAGAGATPEFRIIVDDTKILSVGTGTPIYVAAIHYHKNNPNDLRFVVISRNFDITIVLYQKNSKQALVERVLTPYGHDDDYIETNDCVFLLGSYIYVKKGSQDSIKAYALLTGVENASAITDSVKAFMNDCGGIVTSVYANIVATHTTDGIACLINDGPASSTYVHISYRELDEMLTESSRGESKRMMQVGVENTTMLCVYDEDDGYYTFCYAYAIPYCLYVAHDYGGSTGTYRYRRIQNCMIYVGAYDPHTNGKMIYPLYDISNKGTPRDGIVWGSLTPGHISTGSYSSRDDDLLIDLSKKPYSFANTFVMSVGSSDRRTQIIPRPGNLPLSNGITDQYIYLPS